MCIFNHATYVWTFVLGIESPNMTKIAQAFFELIILNEDIVNQLMNPYNSDFKQVKARFEYIIGVFSNTKTAAELPDIVKFHLILFFVGKYLINKRRTKTKSFGNRR